MVNNLSIIDAVSKSILLRTLDRNAVLRQFDALSDDEKRQLIDSIRSEISADIVKVDPRSPECSERRDENHWAVGAPIIEERRTPEMSPEALLFQESWKEVSLEPSGTDLDSPESSVQQTIIFSDKTTADDLSPPEACGVSVDLIYVVHGESLRKLSERLYCCPANREEHLEALLRQLVADGERPSSIIYDWSKGKGETGIHELFTLFKAIKPFASLIPHITLVGNYDPQSLNACWDYAWIGFQRSLKLHYPDTRISLIYSQNASIRLERVIALSRRESVAWLRGERIYALSLRSVDPPQILQESALKQYGGYLITGGTGALGFTFARYLASHYQAKLILIGRSPLSDAIRRQLDELKQLGALQADYEAVDVSDEDALAALARRLPFDLAGVIHAAGVESGKAFFAKSSTDIHKVMDPKTAGTLLLDQAFGQQPLDFICYFSSSAAFLGDFGSCDYAIANRFQMGYGYYREANKHFRGKTVVINWPLWNSGETGIGFLDKERADFYLKTSGQRAMSARDGIRLWCDLIQSDFTQSLVMLGDPHRITSSLQRLYHTRSNHQTSPTPDRVVAADSETNADRTTEAPDHALKALVSADIKRLISTGYKIATDRLEETAHLAEYGLDSINLTQLAQQLTAHFSIRVTPALFFSHISIDQLSDYFVSRHQAHLQAFYRQASAAMVADHDHDENIHRTGTDTGTEGHVRRQTDTSVRNESQQPEPIAIIGMSGRFPKADTVDELWTLLSDGKSGITEIPESRWNWRDYFIAPGDVNNQIATNQGGFITDIDRFDPLFFDISPREAQDMDPAQRLLLMESYRAIEDAGLSPQSIKGSKTAVFVGMEESQYDMLTGWRGITTGGAAMIASRLSYFLDLQGPAIVTNTACSSGLVALHQAVMSLRHGECDTALVASVSLTLSPQSYITMTRAGMLSPEGRCRSFSADANGIGVGESVVVLLLKPLSAAMADRNPIHGVLKASGINFDGKTNGVTAPNGKRQAELLERIYTEHKIDINDVGHIVAHGTGTKLGDPVEVNALHDAFKMLRDRQPGRHATRAHCAITSCKSNLGHTMAASGLVSVVSLLKSIRHQQIPASLYCEEENPHFNGTDSFLYINKATRVWQRAAGQPRLGAVSAFGRSGTNAHVVIEEYLPAESVRQFDSSLDQRADVAIPLSAGTVEQLRQKAGDLLHFILRVEADSFDRTEATLPDIAYTLQTGRDAMDCRLGFIVGSFSELKEKLAAYVGDQKDIENSFRGETKPNPQYIRTLARDPDMMAAIDKWLAAGKLSQLLEVWVKGLDVDWQRLYEDEQPRRISLPTHPFSGKTYRLQNTAVPATHAADPNNAHRRGKTTVPSPSGELSASSDRPPLVIIGGAGLFGLCMGVFLKKANIPFRIIEKHADVGGVWFVNRWPGCGCDIPMLAYAYSFEHFAGDMWAKQPDILKYLQTVARKYDLYSHITFNTKIKEACWQEDSGQWLLTFENGATTAAKYFVHAANEGLGHTPSVPDIPGMDTFQGPLMHALDCHAENWDFTGKRIAIIGNATTQVQLVEALQPLAERLVVYARSPKYFYPRAHYSRQTQHKLSTDYRFWLKHRREYLATADEFYTISNDPVRLNPFHPDTQVNRFFARDMDDDWRSFYQWLRDIDVVPNYSPGCSRPCICHTYHRQIRADNVELKTVPISKITAAGIETEEDAEAFDIILLATGYDLNDFKPKITIRGRNQLELSEYFASFHKSYAGAVVPQFPNLFLGSGPNSGSNATSITAIYEHGCENFLEIIRYCEANHVKSLEVKEAEAEQFVAFVRKRNQTGSFSTGCSSWFQTKQGENAAVFPGTLEELKRWRSFDQERFHFEYHANDRARTISEGSDLQPPPQSCSPLPDPVLQQLQRRLAGQHSFQKLSLLEKKLRAPEVGELETLLAEMLISSLISMSIVDRQGVKVEPWMSGKQPVPFFERWLESSIRYLQQQRWLSEAHTLNHEVRPLMKLWQEWEIQKKHWTMSPALKSQVMLLEVCLKALPAILSGRRRATDVIFPGASLTLVEGIYRGNPLADFYNELLAETLAVCIEQKQQSGQIRILEIGAGTGGTTSMLLPLLQSCSGSIAEYCYTDLSKAFLKHAEQRYRPRFPALTTALFDVSKPLTTQRVSADHYDVVIATNVLHATPDIRASLRHAKAALKHQGVLLLNELSTWSLFNHLTFGLLDGWWQYEDSELRLPGSPILSPESWQQVLSEEGFEMIALPARQSHQFGQQIIVAGLNGKRDQGTVSQLASFAARAEASEAKAETSISNARQAQQETLDSPTVTDQMMRDQVQAIITEKLSAALEIEPDRIDHDASFADYGIDSILGAEFVQSVNARLQVKLETTNLFDYSSVVNLTQYVLSVWGETIRAQLTQTRVSAEKTQISYTSIPTDEMTHLKRPVFDASSTSKTNRTHDFNQDPIAIVGMSGRFAESESVEAFWENLKDGKDLIKEVSRWDQTQCASPGSAATPYCRRGSFVDSVDLFDAAFFRISPLEAMYMDPQQRLFLEECWKALEHAGYAGKSMDRKRCGVFAGCARSDYARSFSEEPPAQAFWGNAGSVIPARISYYLNLQGPAISVDTACSSSLVSIHLACQSLWSKETDMALAGGVFLQLAPDYYQVSNRAGMLSPEGKCHAFDASANGFVPGEGLGVIVLKRLQDALQDGDSVHGVIIGSGVNQDGSTNGITAPSAQSQQRLQLSVYERFNINPETIQVVEAHGTGTPLGDPVEFSALTHAFRQYTDKKQFCAIGSVKTNIGHATLAAGIAGVLKIVMALKHRQIPALLHYQEPNPAIDFASSPFYPPTRLSEWHVADGRRRRAAISSFGLSGTNAHMVIEEMPEAHLPVIESPGYLVVLSARTAEQLKQQARNLLTFCMQMPNVSMNDMSYTLFVGRMHLTHRLACIARSQPELIQLLEQWLTNTGKTARDGRIHASALPEGKLREQGSLKKFGNQCIQECHTAGAVHYLEHLATIAELYIQGYELAFHELFSHDSKRIPLPTYPFARDRHWVDAAGPSRPTTTAMALDVLHPLLHRNTSDLAQQRYSTEFRGDEFFLKDHQINGQRILPAVAYLEIARAAIMQAWPDRPESAVLELQDTVWLRPLAVAARTQVSIDLFVMPPSQGQEPVGYEIYSLEAEQRIVHCQGKAVFSRHSESSLADIRQLQNEMKVEHPAADIYAAFTGMGVNYGPAHRGIVSVRFADQQCLGWLSLPSVVDNGHQDYGLHPSLMDCALQASVGLVADSAQAPNQVLLPFALEALRVFSPCTREMLAWARFAPGSKANDKVTKLDIDLMGQDGQLCVQLKGLSFRALTGGLDVDTASGLTGSLLAVPTWEPVSATAGTGSWDEHHIILCDTTTIDPGDLQARIPRSRCQQLQAAEGNIAERYSQHALTCFELIKGILKGKPRGPVLIQMVVLDDPAQTVFAGLSGLLKTAALENPMISGQMIVIEPGISTKHLANRLLENQAARSEAVIRYRNGVKHVLRWQERRPARKDPYIVFQDHGVYLIVGGLGGLGIIFTREILRQAPNARLILTGRSPLTDEQRTKLDALLSSRKEAIDYRQLDICDAKQVTALIAAIQSQYKRLNGIIHCAGMIADRFILNKTAEEFSQVLAPKVAGTWHLDQASRQLDLDFLVLFSSQASAMGSVGQADYAAANGFMDWFADFRNQLATDHKRRGQTLSINWPLWQEGGMKADQAIQEQLRRNTGMLPMQTSTGLHSFYQSLALGHGQVRAMEGHLPQMRHVLFNADMPSQPTPAKDAPMPATLPTPDSLLEKTQDFLSKQLASLLKLTTHHIDPQAPLEQYGIDSILTVNLANQLEKTFGALSKTLLFEHQTIGALAEYFMASHADKLARLFASADRRGTEQQKNDSPADSFSEAQRRMASPPVPDSRRRQRSVPAAITSARDDADDPVAIIGLSGRYPQAFDIQEYWRNLSEGKDCITEVPKARWDWREYYSEDRSQIGYHFSKWGGFIDGVDEFDPFFFNISPREAEYTDPQERLFLQHAWMALEDAGYTRAGLQIPDEHDMGGQVGVYVGVMYGEYQLFGAEASLRGNRMGFAGSLASIANRVSYILNAHGPSMTLDTMCSSSLTAIHLACQDLKQRRTHLAIAGGVNISIHPNKYLMLSAGQFISSEGRCQSFGEGGDGYIPGEGVGVVVLKRLSEAQRDKDFIYGIIKGSALNHGGKTNGYTVPNPQAQAAAVRRVLAESNTDPRHISYIEAHGTGTKLGDPIEIAALTKAFGKYTQDTGFCFIGSAKSNIGHCESAAGIAGLTKVLLQMKCQKIVPSLHSATLNPNIDFDRTPFVVNQSLRHWENPVIDGQQIPRIAGISSFGAGGSNAHILIEEYPDDRRNGRALTASNNAPSAIVLSAKNDRRLREMAEKIKAFIAENPTLILSDMAYTLQVGREPMEERLGILVSSVAQLAEKLELWLAGEQDIEDLWQGQVKKNDDTIAMFSGDSDLQETIDKWMTQKRYPKLLELWAKGLNPNWNTLYGNDKPFRISLPVYPFARERYWTPESSNGSSEKGQSSRDGSVLPTAQRSATVKPFPDVSPSTAVLPEALNGADDLSWDQLTYRPVWDETPAPRVVRQNRPLQHILLVYGDSALQLVNDIQAQCMRNHPEAKLTQIRLGNSTKRISDTEWSCDVHDPDGFHWCLKDDQTPDGLFFVATVPKAPLSADSHQQIQHSAGNEIQLLRLVKTLQTRSKTDTRIDCFILTLDNHRPDDGLNEPHGAGLTGLAYAVAQGDHRFLVRNIDLSSSDFMADETRQSALKMILDESPADRGTAVKLLGGRRYQQSFLQWHWDSASKSPGFREGGVYLIAGGSGTVGQIITRYLIQRYRAQVVWLGRTAESNSSLQEKLARFRELGTTPWYIQADITRMDSLRQAIDKVKETHPVLNGAIFSSLVFHAENSVARTTEHEFVEMLEVKVTGSRHFFAALQNEPLDFLCYFSSVQSFSFLSAKDSVGYATGITFADALAKSQRHHSRFPVGIINWGYWEATVKGTPLEIPLSVRFGLIRDQIGTRFFDQFISQLQQGGTDQLLCMHASQPLREMMGMHENEVSYLSAQANPSLFARLKEEHHAPLES